jgi:aquaporin Z
LKRIFAAEMFGTFCLVFAGTGAIVVNAIRPGTVTHVGVSIVFGLVVMAMIYSVGETSGAHLNPAVTAGFWLAGRLRGRLVPVYVSAQIAGALLASIVVQGLFGHAADLGCTQPAGSAWQAFLLELILTLILMVVILCVSTGSKETGVMAGIAIGGVIGLEAMFAGPISGASMNPARSLGPAIIAGNFHLLWLYLTAPVLGSAMAVPIWFAISTRTLSHSKTVPAARL